MNSKETMKNVNLDFQLITDEATRKKKLKIDVWFGSRKTTTTIYTVLSHVENLINGVIKGYRYKMQFVYTHFPINAGICNYLGEKNVRKAEICNFLVLVGMKIKLGKILGLLRL
uniref:Putative 60S ribosomal protein L9-like n=1 Tax=Davidia involucrata TaxID=16924 RepID=A0A5B6YXX6_DAVIN